MYVITQKTDYLFGFIPVVIEYQESIPVYTSGVQYVALRSDFDKSITLAWEYKNNNYGGYNLITINSSKAGGKL